MGRGVHLEWSAVNGVGSRSSATLISSEGATLTTKVVHMLWTPRRHRYGTGTSVTTASPSGPPPPSSILMIRMGGPQAVRGPE
ncbi:hypothetical protein FRAHR75_770003 [Frankia sp. Hr75.2]|nr:hypothetical protein FRAHR75_770003 [Frankia sp. Hr75.2]